MKTKEELDYLIDGSSKRRMLCAPGSAQRKEHENEVVFYRDCKTLLLALNEEGLKKQLDRVKSMLQKYQNAKTEAEKNTSSAKVKAALNEANTRFKPDQLRKQERLLMFIFSNH